MAGQSVGLVTREQSTAEILGELVDQALAVLLARESRKGGRRRLFDEAPESREAR